MNCSWCSSEDQASRDMAIKHIQKAVLQLPSIKKIKKQVENYIYRKAPFDKETWAIIGSTVLTVQKGEINTRVIKKMDVKVLGGNMRPDVLYDFNKNIISGFATINWSF